MAADFEVRVVIAGFGHRNCPRFEVFVRENERAAAVDSLEKALSAKGAPCAPKQASVMIPDRFAPQ